MAIFIFMSVRMAVSKKAFSTQQVQQLFLIRTKLFIQITSVFDKIGSIGIRLYRCLTNMHVVVYRLATIKADKKITENSYALAA